MRPRPDWLRVVDGGAGSSDFDEPAANRPSTRPPAQRSPRRMDAYQRPGALAGMAFNVEEHASFRWNASPWVKWLPAVLCCSVLSGAMLWNLGRLWLENAGAPLLGWRPTHLTIATAAPSTPARAAQFPQRPARTDRSTPTLRTQPAPTRPAPDSSETLGMLATASLLASLPPEPAGNPPAARRLASAPAATRNPAPPVKPAATPSQSLGNHPAPVASQERIVRVLPIRHEAEREADVQEITELLKGLPEGIKRDVMESVRHEIQAHLMNPRYDPRGANAPHGPAVPPAVRTPPAVQVAVEHPVDATAGAEHRIVLFDDGGKLRILIPKLAAPATPKG